jgi:hypothetical protein
MIAPVLLAQTTAAATAPGSSLPSQPLAPAWLVLPMAVATLLVLAAHVQALHAAANVPRSRRRIRSINAGLMLVTVPVLAYSFGIATPARSQAFAVAWSASALLLALVVLVALIDVANTWRLHAEQRHRLQAQIRALRAAAQRQVAQTHKGGPSSDPPSRTNDSGPG